MAPSFQEGVFKFLKEILLKQKDALVTALDEDGDGELSIEELEAGGSHMLDWVEANVRRTSRALVPYKGVIMFSVGVIGCFYGKNFTYSILFVQAFRASGWPVVRRATNELKETYTRTRASLKKELPHVMAAKDTIMRVKPELEDTLNALKEAQEKGASEAEMMPLIEKASRLQNELTTALTATSSLSAISRSIDPAKLKDVVMGFYTGMLSVMATAMSGGAAKIGIGVNIGNILNDVAMTIIKPMAISSLKWVSEGGSLEISLRDPEVMKWVDFFLGSLCSAGGVAIAFYMDSIVYTVSNSLIGGEIMVQQVTKLSNEFSGVNLSGTVVETGLKWGLCASGCYYQLIHGGGELPAALKIALFAPLLGERTLRAMAAIVRANTFGGPVP